MNDQRKKKKSVDVHVVLMSEISHRTVEECTASKIEKSTGIFTVRNDDKIQTTMLEDRTRLIDQRREETDFAIVTG